MNNVSEEEIDGVVMLLMVKWLTIGMSLLMAVFGIVAAICAIVGFFGNNLLIFFVSIGMIVVGLNEIVVLFDLDKEGI